MAYEDMTYEVILQRMKNKVTTDYPNLDVREGSVIFNALAPAALELAIAYSNLDNVLNESFVNTASREYLYIACDQMGIDTTQFDASAGKFQGDFNVEVPIGSRWNCDIFNYTVTEFIGQDSTTDYYEYTMLCDTVGTVPNTVTGSLTPITDNPTGLSYAELTACLIEGENEVSDSDIRLTYFNHVNAVIADGNISQYEQWCNDFDGIGHYKIIPLWNGDNTVKVSILSASNRAASSTLINDFQEYLSPLSGGVPDGMGNGVAPIGAFVTVSTASEESISVAATVTLKDGYSDTTSIDTALTNYFAKIAYNKLVVPYMTVGAVILEAEGVESISNLLVNNGIDDITLTTEQIPVKGTTTWTVV